MDTSTLLQHLFQGVAVGATYAFVALGFSMQFSAMRLINFAHGESFALGAFVALTLMNLGLGYFATFAATLLVMAVVGIGIERLVIRSLYGKPELMMFIVTIGLSLVIRQAINLVWGADARPFPAGFGDGAFDLGFMTMTHQQVGSILIAIGLMAVLELYLHRSREGTAMRSVAQDVRTASLMGIDVNGVRAMVFGISTALGAAAGILFASLTFASFDMGLWMGIKGFAAAVLGGLGSLPGAIVGGLVLGLAEQLAGGYISSLYRDATALSVLILVLLLRPQGLLGRGGSPWGKV